MRLFLIVLCASILALTTSNASPTIPNTIIPANSAGVVINLAKYITVSAVPSNTVVVNSSMGNFCIQLFPTNAPATVANFLAYVTNGSYDNMLVNLTVPGSIIQTGGYEVNSSLSAITPLPAITNEFGIAGLSNVRGTVSMSLVGTNPNSATSEWFINVTNNGSQFDATNTAGNPPSTVFGEVTGNGMSVVDKIAALPTDNFENFGFGAALTNVPLQNWKSGDGVYLNNLVDVYNVVIPPAVVCSDTNSFSAELQGNNLVVKPLTPNTAPVTISLYTADTNGDAEVLSFQVSQEKLPQNIDFPTSYTTYSTRSFSIPNYPSASSGLGVGVTFKSGPLKFTAGVPYLSGTGTITLLATQPGNFFYAAAPSEIGHVIVDKGSQSITFPSISNPTNSTLPFSLSLTNYPYSTVGLPVSVGVQSGSAMLKGKELTVTGDGTITLSASQAGTSDFYPATTVTTSFVVSPKPTPTPTP